MAGKKAALILVRHGETFYNREHRLTGQSDISLTPEGEQQARDAGGLIRDVSIHKVFSSKLSRAFNTAALMLKHSGVHKDKRIEQRAEINERHTGDFTGRSYMTDPEILAFPFDKTTPLPNGESTQDVIDRVQDFYHKDVLPRLKKGESVMVVAHAGVLRAFDAILGMDDPQPKTKRKVPNATPLVVHYEDGLIKHWDLKTNGKTPVNDSQRNDQPPKIFM